jgi:hypothetical protein
MSMGQLVIRQVIFEYGDPWQNDIGSKTEELKEKPVPLCRFVHHKSHMD